MNVKRLPIDSFEPQAYNPRKDLLPGDREYREIERSLEEFGLVEPLVGNDATGNLVGGHQRLKILKAQGATEAWFSVITEPDQTRERALNVRLNGSTGEWDVSKLEDLLGDDTTLQDLAGMTRDDLEELSTLAERDAAYEALKVLDGDPSAKGVPYGGRPPEGVEDERPFGVEGGHLHQFNFGLTPEQRRVVLTAIATAKELWGVQTQPEALSQICEFFSNRAEAGDATVGD